ncbi:hypothetical protein MHM93_07295 [Pseudoalteromonas sp. MM17-2]|uniref:hypothetical protein n=1 Tax=Pseudoalteromonas sp. MM17-2 TaxID=2917753 RepID=UPI001EF4BCBE|nr:hypothetical protein [Pseudoalteromonas sp. MM17-2]MCG7543983.1 hypothetical protein [Pseudoalteromonas sp. MM17-2]
MQYKKTYYVIKALAVLSFAAIAFTYWGAGLALLLLLSYIFWPTVTAIAIQN